jgi:hypothetical protein
MRPLTVGTPGGGHKLGHHPLVAVDGDDGESMVMVARMAGSPLLGG